MKKEQISAVFIEVDQPEELDYYDENSIRKFEEDEEIDGYDSGFMTGYLAA